MIFRGPVASDSALGPKAEVILEGAGRAGIPWSPPGLRELIGLIIVFLNRITTVLVLRV